MANPANRPPETRTRIRGKFAPGVSGNPSGRPKAIREIEAMLDAEHRTVENMREVYARLRALAIGEPMDIRNGKGELIRVELRSNPGFMELYLNRVQGPVEKIRVDLTDAPDAVVAWLSEHLN